MVSQILLIGFLLPDGHADSLGRIIVFIQNEDKLFPYNFIFQTKHNSETCYCSEGSLGPPEKRCAHENNNFGNMPVSAIIPLFYWAL